MRARNLRRRPPPDNLGFWIGEKGVGERDAGSGEAGCE